MTRLKDDADSDNNRSIRVAVCSAISSSSRIKFDADARCGCRGRRGHRIGIALVGIADLIVACLIIRYSSY